MVPSVVVVVPKWPLNSSGKLDRKALPQPTAQIPSATIGTVQSNGSLAAAATAGLTSGEAAVAEACAAVLRVPVEQLGRDVSLLELGLSSLQAAKLHRELAKRGLKGVKSAATVLQHPTVAGLAGLTQGQSVGVLECGLELENDGDEGMELEQAVATLVSKVLGEKVETDTELQMHTGQLRQLVILLYQKLDVWLMPDQLAKLRTVRTIAEHVEGEPLWALLDGLHVC